MSKLEKAIISLNKMQNGLNTSMRDPRAVTLVALLYLVILLSVPLTSLPTVIWLGIYPIIVSQTMGGGYTNVFIRSLYVLPFIILIGIFNPLLDKQEVFAIGRVSISRGWITFISIIFRGLWAVQTVIALIHSIGFSGFCRGLGGLGVPKLMTTLLLMVYRYLGVLLEEALSMKRARESRGFGRGSLPLKLWGTMIGQLFVRTVDRSGKIHSAMLSRGFDGELPYSGLTRRWTVTDSIYVFIWSLVFIVMRIIPPERLF